MIHANLYLRIPNDTKETPIFLRIFYENQTLKYPTLIKVLPQFWDFNKQRIKPTKKIVHHLKINAYLEHLHNTAIDAFWELKQKNDGISPPRSELKEALDQMTGRVSIEKPTLLSFFEKMIDQSKKGTRINPQTGERINLNTIRTYNTTFHHLLKFQKLHKHTLNFEDINQDFYSDYIEFLTMTVKLSTNTVGKHIQILKLIMNEALEAGATQNQAHRSRRFISIKEESESIYLNKKELVELENIDLSKNKALEKVRDLFLIGCYTGLRYSDYSTLTIDKIKDGFIRGFQIKTGNPVTIPLHDTVIKILKKYKNDLPKSISNQKTNSHLKEIGKMMPSLQLEVEKSFTKEGVNQKIKYKKWELLTTHTARRSFATNEFLEGTPTLTIMAITGHKTEKAFLKYIKLSSADHANILREQWRLRKKKETPVEKSLEPIS